jgi:release factor glutamine methyltransferase
MSDSAITQLPVTLGKVLRESKTPLAAVSSTPSLDVQVLLAHITGKSRANLLAHPEDILGAQELQLLEEALQKLESGFPLPYLLGEWEFFGLKFKVTPDTLIPRPETELLVETALNWLMTPERMSEGSFLGIDIGTGTGCIAISLATHYPKLHTLATDLSHAALAVAQYNARTHNVADRITFLQADLFNLQSPLSIPCQPSSVIPHHLSFDLIVANPPYIPTRTLQTLDIYEREPTLALDGGPDGLTLISRLLSQAATRLAPNGLMLMEIEASQGPAVVMLARKHFPHTKIKIIPDLAGRDRLLVVEASTSNE